MASQKRGTKKAGAPKQQRKASRQEKIAVGAEHGRNKESVQFKSTKDVAVPEKLIDQVIGQENAVKIIKKAARQRRHVLLIGEPGVGKTMLAQAMAELLSSTELEDILAFRNVNDENQPLIKAVKTYPTHTAAEKLGDGQGRLMLQKERMKNRVALGRGGGHITGIILIIVLILLGLAFSGLLSNYELIVLAALLLGVMVFGSVALFTSGLTRRVGGMPGLTDSAEPKLIVDNSGLNHAPFIDATGNKAGALRPFWSPSFCEAILPLKQSIG